MWNKTILILMMAGVMMMSLSNASLYEDFINFFEPLISFFSEKEPVQALKYSDTPDNTEKDFILKKASRHNDIVIISDKEFRAEWYPDNSPLSDYRNLTVTFQVENIKTGKNYSLKGNGLIPKNHTGEFDINTSAPNLLTIPYDFDWEYSEEFSTKIMNYTADMNETAKSLIIEEKSYSNYKKGVPAKAEIEGGFLDPTVSACGPLSSSGTYTLTESISGIGTCITIGAANVYLDCKGYIIQYATDGEGAGGLGIDGGSGFDNINITNCQITTPTSTLAGLDGIYFASTINSRIYNNTIRTNGTGASSAVNLQSNSNSNNISYNTIAGRGGSTNSIYIDSSSNNYVAFNTITGNGTSPTGVHISTSANNNKILNNNITVRGSTSTVFGVDILTSSKGNLVSENFISVTGTTGDAGVKLGSNNNTVYLNNITANGTGTTYGIQSLTTFGNNISFNNISSEGYSAGGAYGVYFSNTQNTSFSSNTIRSLGSNSHGIFMDNTNTFGINLTGNVIYQVGTIVSRDLVFGTAGINNTLLTDQSIKNYSFAGAGGTISIVNSTKGKIEFFSKVNGTGGNLYGNSSSDVEIRNNSVRVSAPNLNVSANVTMLNMNEFTFITPAIGKDGVECSDCFNFTGLTANMVIFNVTKWSNYSILETSDVNPPTFTLNQTNVTSTTPINGTTVQLNISINDSTGVNSYRLTINDTLDGSYVNQTINYVSGNITAIFNYTIVNISANGGGIGWKVWANDTSGFTAESSTFTFIVKAPVTDTCACPSPAANWNILLSDECKIYTDCNIRPFNLSVSGTGNLSVFAIIYASNLIFQLDIGTSGVYLNSSGELLPNNDS